MWKGAGGGEDISKKVLYFFTTFPKAPWKGILLNMLTVVELVKKFTTFYGTHTNGP